MPVPPQSPVPRARLDPIRSGEAALAVFGAQMSRPLRAETLVMFLDGNHCGSTLVTVTDTVDPVQIVDVAEAMAMAGGASPDVQALVLATIRPGGGPCSDDDRLWQQASDVVEAVGLTLLDWFVVGRHGAHSPREMLGIPSRWSAPT